MKRPRILLQVLSILLTAALLSQIPVVAFAEEPPRPPAPEEITVTAPEFPDEAQNDVHIITELPDRRDAYTKQFFLSDGTIRAVQYAFPVHFETADGTWQQYDNRMAETSDVLDAEAAAEEAAMQTLDAADAQTGEYRVIRSGAVVYTITAPVMQDANGVRRSAFRLTESSSAVDSYPAHDW